MELPTCTFSPVAPEHGMELPMWLVGPPRANGDYPVVPLAFASSSVITSGVGTRLLQRAAESLVSLIEDESRA